MHLHTIHKGCCWVGICLYLVAACSHSYTRTLRPTIAATDCPAGFSGKDCNTQISQQLLGTYRPVDVCTQGGSVEIGSSFVYNNIVVSQGDSPDQIVMENFGGFDSPCINVRGYITSDSTFVVPLQQYTNKASSYMQVKGQPDKLGIWKDTLAIDYTSGNTHMVRQQIMVLSYEIYYPHDQVDICKVVFWRQ